jgi:hypothetical protein
VYIPEGRIEIAVLANSMEFDAAPIVREAVAAALALSPAERAVYDHPAPAPGEDARVTATARAQFEAVTSGVLDRTVYTAALNEGLTPELIEQVRASLAALGPAIAFTFVSRANDGRYETYVYKVQCTQGSVRESFSLDAEGKIAGLYFRPWDG